MLDYLVDHARRNVWCTPDQDLQVILQPARITPNGGVVDQVSVMWTYYPLPSTKEKYHVYQIGQIHPKLLGLLDRRKTWVLLSEVCEAENLIVDLYIKSGLQFPRVQSWMWIGPSKEILIAVKVNDKIANLDQEPLYVRLYSNAYFNSKRREEGDGIKVVGRVIADNRDRTLLQRDFHDHLDLKGYSYAFVNGRLVNDLGPNNCAIGDVAEFVYDSSIYRIIDFKLSELATFNSLLDLKRKYLVHYAQLGNEFIDYRDDIDLWLIDPSDTSPRFQGVYYHKNQEDALRMVTHKDYSIPVAYVNAFVEEHATWDDVMSLTLRATVRNSGYARPLVNEHHRIKELYKLNDADVKKALLGIDSNVDEWRADHLEQSGYVALMRDSDGILDKTLVQNAYGYNAITKLLADTPQRVTREPNYNYVDLPLALQSTSTVYEYAQDRRLLGFYLHRNESRYNVRNAGAHFVEVLTGIGSSNQGTVYNASELTLDPALGYRFYICPLVNGEPTGQWQDVTGDSSYYVVENNRVRWLVDSKVTATAVRSDDRHLARSFDLIKSDGLFKFNITAEEYDAGVLVNRKASIPPAKLDLWLNGRALIERLDYFVQWPEVVIVNKEYLSNTGTETVTVRAYGFCDSELQREPANEFGFVEHGLMSRNRRFDIRDDKVIRIVVEGGIYTQEELLFSEDDNGIRMENIRNGAPYVIDDVIIPLRGLECFDTYQFRARSRAVDDKISDYMTLRLPEPERDIPSIIPRRYQIFSPLCSKVMHDLQSGILDLGDAIKKQYSDAKIWEWLKDYLYLLDYEPIKHGVTRHYVEVHPHNYNYVTELNVYQYTFLERVIRVLLDSQLHLTGHVIIVELNHE